MTGKEIWNPNINQFMIVKASLNGFDELLKSDTLKHKYLYSRLLRRSSLAKQFLFTSEEITAVTLLLAPVLF